MSKKVLLIVGIFVALVLVGIVLFINGNQEKQHPTTQQSLDKPIYPSREPANKPQTKLRFIPDPMTVNDEGEVEAEVFLDAFENQVTAVHLEIGYDPKVFKVLEVKASDFLGGKPVDVEKIDTVNGRITFGAHVDLATTPPLMGSDEMLEIEFQKITDDVPSSVVSFLPGTTVTAQGIKGNAMITTVNGHIDLVHTSQSHEEHEEEEEEGK